MERCVFTNVNTSSLVLSSTAPNRLISVTNINNFEISSFFMVLTMSVIVIVMLDEEHWRKQTASRKSVLHYHYLAHFASSRAIVSFHVPSMCNVQGNRMDFNYT